MDVGTVSEIAQKALYITTVLAAPPLLAALLVGVAVGVLQAATSVQEMTLSFIPKLAVMLLALVLFGEWQLSILAEHFETIFERVRTVTL